VKRDFVCVERGVYKDKVYKERGVYKRCIQGERGDERGVYKERERERGDERGVYKDKVYKERGVYKRCIQGERGDERGVYKETRTLSVSHQLFSAEETNMSKETCACEKRLVHVKRDL